MKKQRETFIQKFNSCLVISIVFVFALPSCFPSFSVDLCGDTDCDCPNDEGDGDIDDGGECEPGCKEGRCEVGQWARICAGTFVMGSPPDEAGGNIETETQHEVTLTQDFEILSTEVTQQDFLYLTGFNPSHDLFDGCQLCPVDSVTWHEAVLYCNILSSENGLETCYVCTNVGRRVTCQWNDEYTTPYACPGYRLPTEAEWEYAARAGTTTTTYSGDPNIGEDRPGVVLDPIAWWESNSSSMTHEVGLLRANPWGLYDMLGNAAEWTHDGRGRFEPYDPVPVTDPFGDTDNESRVIRGGAWFSEVFRIRSADRVFDYPDNIFYTNGLRPVRTLN